MHSQVREISSVAGDEAVAVRALALVTKPKAGKIERRRTEISLLLKTLGLIGTSFRGLRTDQGRLLQAAVDSCSSAFVSDASSATFRQVLERSIWRIKPHRTFPGPTSMKVSTCCAISRRMHCSHFTEPVTWRTRVSRARRSSVTN